MKKTVNNVWKIPNHQRGLFRLSKRKEPGARNSSKLSLVRATGIEPAWKIPPDPKSGASASSATPANE